MSREAKAFFFLSFFCVCDFSDNKSMGSGTYALFFPPAETESWKRKGWE